MLSFYLTAYITTYFFYMLARILSETTSARASTKKIFSVGGKKGYAWVY